MIIYILKSTLCSALLLLIYFLFLEKEKMHRFNRFYLLFSIVFSYTVPLITFTATPQSFPASDAIELVHTNIYEPITQQVISPPATSNYLSMILMAAYCLVCSVLLFRFIRNLAGLMLKAKANPKVPYYNAILVLLTGNQVEHSFFNYIFINKGEYEGGSINSEILCHELTHVRQKHSIDIVFAELMLAVAWINPALYFYRKAIRLNHEFLADEKVIRTFKNVQSYQLLLLNVLGRSTNAHLASRFNFSITKKRLVMMTRNTSRATAMIRQIALLPLLAATVFAFSDRTMAQEPTKPAQPAQPKKSNDSAKPEPGDQQNVPKHLVGISVGWTKEGAIQEQLSEYESIISKYRKDRDWHKGFAQAITPTDRHRLEALFRQMSKEQQLRQDVFFVAAPKPLPRVVPTDEQFNSWKDGKTYGVWIDGKRVANASLNNYDNSDFAQVFVSKLGKNTVNYGKHYYQVDLMTKSFYQKHYDEAMAQQKPRMVFRKPGATIL